MGWQICFVVFLCIIFVESKLDIEFDENYNDYSIIINGNKWLESESTKFMNYGDWASLKLNGTTSQKGMDTFGNYTETTISFIDDNHRDYCFEIILKQYPNIIVFTQHYPNGAKQTYRNDINTVISSFPSFKIRNVSNLNNNSNININLGYIKWAGIMSGTKTEYGQWTDNLSHSSSLKGGIEDSGPLLLFRESLTECVVISSLTYSMTSNHEVLINNNNQRYIRWGIQGNVTKVDIGFKISYILSLTNSGINQCMTNWGDLLLKYYDKPRGNAHKRDFTLNYLGYSTDNGAFYFFHQEPGKNAEETMIDIKRYHDSLNIPTRYLLLDAWWYQISGTVNGHDPKDYNFSANVTLFPNGQHIYDQTGWFIQAQNGAFSFDCVYSKDFQFTFNKTTFESAPIDTDKFFDYLFSNNNRQKGAMIVYEQDHLSEFTVNLQIFVNNTEFGRQYMMSMGNMALKYNLSTQWCMTYPRHILQSVELASVTQARVTPDYQPGSKQWNIGHSALFASSLDIMPSKDSYWSMNTPQTSGDRGVCTENHPCIEPHNRLQSAILSLSNGPITFSDRIGYSDYNVIMKCCMNTSGLLLRPTLSITPIDKYFIHLTGFANGVNGEVYTTMSIINSSIGNIYYYYIFAAQLNSNFSVKLNDITYYNPNDVHKVNISNYLVYEANTTDRYIEFNKNKELELPKCGEYDFRLYTVVPFEYYSDIGWYLLGEMNKWITVSSQRFTNIEIDNNNNKQLNVFINGDENETINIGFVNDNQQQKIVQCIVPKSGKVIITMPDATCN